jgi:hypothetical protein
MKVHELIKNHDGLVFFYPFSGIHFDIINPLKSAITGLNRKVLFVYCSIGGSQEEFDNWSINNPLALGRYEDVNYTENKLGLKKIKIESCQKLTDEEFEANYYSFDNCELIFIKGEAFKFIDYLRELDVDLVKMNLILSYAYGFGDVLKALILKFHPIRTNEDDEKKTKILVINNHYLDDIKELYSQTTCYQYSFEIEERAEDNRNENYTVFFEDKGEYFQANIFRRPI